MTIGGLPLPGCPDGSVDDVVTLQLEPLEGVVDDPFLAAVVLDDGPPGLLLLLEQAASARPAVSAVATPMARRNVVRGVIRASPWEVGRTQVRSPSAAMA